MAPSSATLSLSLHAWRSKFLPFPVAFAPLAASPIPKDVLHQIVSDVHRTTRDEQCRSDLLLVLTAFAAYNHDIGYCQGLSCYGAFLLTLFSAEDTFYALSSIIHANHIAGLFDKDLSLVDTLLLTHKNVLNLTLPETVRAAIEQISEGSQDYCVGWYLTFFSRCNYDLALEASNLLFTLGFPALFNVASAVVEVGYFTHLAPAPGDTQHHLLFKLPYLPYNNSEILKVAKRNNEMLGISQLERMFCSPQRPFN